MEVLDTWVQNGYTYAYCKCGDISKDRASYTVYIAGNHYVIGKENIDFMTGISGMRLMAFRLPGKVEIPKGYFSVQ